MNTMETQSLNPQQQHRRKVEGKFGGSKLHQLAKSNQWSMLLASCTTDLLWVLDEHNRTILHYAFENGAESDCILELIRLAPYQVRVADTAKETPIHMACDYGCSLIVAYALLEAEYKEGRGKQSILRQPNAQGKTPLDLIRHHDLSKTKPPSELTQQQQRPTSATYIFGVFSHISKAYSILPWKYHVEEHEGVLQVFEEADRGETGMVGMAY